MVVSERVSKRRRTTEQYDRDVIEHFERSALAKKYLLRKATASENTSRTYRSRIAHFGNYVYVKHGKKELDDFIAEIKAQKHDPYDVLAEFASFVKDDKEHRVSSNTLRFIIITTKKFLRFSGCAVNNEDFRDNISLPRQEIPDLQALSKNDVVTLLNACKNIRLKTYVMFLAQTGARAVEATAARMQDMTLDGNVPTVTFRKEYSKMRKARTRYLTQEMAAQLKLWIAMKYKPHTSTTKDGRRYYAEPKPLPSDLVFAAYHPDNYNPTPEIVYDSLLADFTQVREFMGMGKKNPNDARRDITLHSLRRFCKTTISDLGYGDFSEFWIGHSGSTYYRKPETEKLQLWKKIEPTLTFLDAKQMEAVQRDMQSQLEQEREQRLSLQEQMQIMARAMAAPDEETKRKELEKLARMGFFKTQRVD